MYSKIISYFYINVKYQHLLILVHLYYTPNILDLSNSNPDN